MRRNQKEIAVLIVLWFIAFWVAPHWFLPIAWGVTGLGLYILGRVHEDRVYRQAVKGRMSAALATLTHHRIQLYEHDKARNIERPRN